MIEIDKNAFIKYIVSPCCDACYSYDLVEESNQILKECKHIQFLTILMNQEDSLVRHI